MSLGRNLCNAMKEGWEIKKLGEVCEIIMGQSPVSDSYNMNKEGMPFFQGCSDFGEISPNIKKYCSLPNKIALVNDILMSVRAPVGSTNIANCTCCIGRGLAAIRSIPEFVCYKYVYYYLFQTRYILENLGTGAVFKAINKNVLNDHIIVVPPISEQKRIVEELDLLNGTLDKKRQQLKELDALSQSVFYDMFGDPIENEKGWEIKAIGNIADCASGGTPSRTNPHYFEGTINWYSAGELNSLYLIDSVEHITETALKESNAKLFKANSLLVGMYDTAAFKLGILTKESSSNQACANIILHEDNVIWLYFTLSEMKDEALKHRKGARQKNLNLSFIRNFCIPVPPISLQNKFAEKIKSIEHQKELIKQSIAETQTLLDSRMDYYFN